MRIGAAANSLSSESPAMISPLGRVNRSTAGSKMPFSNDPRCSGRTTVSRMGLSRATVETKQARPLLVSSTSSHSVSTPPAVSSRYPRTVNGPSHQPSKSSRCTPKSISTPPPNSSRENTYADA